MARHFCPRCGVETVFFISAEAEERCSCCSRMLQKFLRDDTDAPAKGRPRLPETHHGLDEEWGWILDRGGKVSWRPTGWNVAAPISSMGSPMADTNPRRYSSGGVWVGDDE